MLCISARKRRCSGTGRREPDRRLSLHARLLLTDPQLLKADQMRNLTGWLTSQGDEVRHLNKGCQALDVFRGAAPSRPSGGCPRRHSCGRRELRACGGRAGCAVTSSEAICNCRRALQIANILRGFFSRQLVYGA